MAWQRTGATARRVSQGSAARCRCPSLIVGAVTETVERALPTGSSEAGEGLRPQEEAGWNRGSPRGRLAGEVVRACFTGALLLRLKIAELRTSKGALIGYLLTFARRPSVTAF